MQLPWILVVAGWCVFGRAESAIIEDSNQLHDARLIGGGPVDTDLPQPIVGVLIATKGTHFKRVCEALLLRLNRNFQRSYFLTAAECLDRGRINELEFNFKLYRDFKEGNFVVHSKEFQKHPKYDKETKVHNVGVFSASYSPSAKPKYEIVIRDNETGPATAQAEVFTWKNITEAGDYRNFFKLYSLKTNVISSFWCKLLYPFSLLKKNHLCASGAFFKGLTKDQIGTPLIQRDPETNSRFWLTGIATNIRPWSPYLSFPMEFLDIKPYKAWIESVLP